MLDLQQFKRNEYSQCGEDGILERLFEELEIETGTFCEFGAYDGKHLSNTRRLFERGWRGLLIEGDRERYEALARNVASDRAECIHAWVRPNGHDSLDDLFSRSKTIHGSLDLLSIDIDSDDLAVWQGLTSLRPAVVAIEFNPTIPFDVEFVNPPGQNKGNSAAAIHRYAQKIGYDLVAVTAWNLIFVDSARRPASLGVQSLALATASQQKRYFFGYDGTLLVASTNDQGQLSVDAPELIQVPWKRAFFAQPTPPRFRGFYANKIRSGLLMTYSYLVATATRPRAVLEMARKRR